MITFFRKVEMDISRVCKELNTNGDPVVHIKSEQRYWTTKGAEPVIFTTNTWLTIAKGGRIVYHRDRWEN